MKKALLVGINDYPGTQNDLQGCVNDITNVYDVLVKYFGFVPTDITMLADRRATKKAILEGLERLISRAATGDTLVFHYSGHGSQVADTDGDEPADRKDEIICPWDYDWDGTYIRDDDFADIFGDLPRGVSLEVILDSCHSGTGTREMVLNQEDHREPCRRARCQRPPSGPARTASGRAILAPPPDIALRADPTFGRDLPVRRLARNEKMNHVLWAACRDSQYSADADVGGTPGGAFTYFFCKHIRDTERTDLAGRPSQEGARVPGARRLFPGAAARVSAERERVRCSPG